MIDRLSEIQRAIGSKSDAASASGSLMARLAELLTNRITTTIMGRIDVAVSSILSTTVNSIQDVTVTMTTAETTKTATITSVSTSKTRLAWRGCQCTSGTAVNNVADHWAGGAQLTNATTVTFTRVAGVNQTRSWTAKVYVLEHK